MVSLQPPAAGGVVAPSSGRGVLKADPTDPGAAGLWMLSRHRSRRRAQGVRRTIHGLPGDGIVALY